MEQKLPRLTVKEIRNEAFSFFNLEKGIPFTFISLLRKPFETIQTYLNYDRRKYTNPIKYLVFAAAIYAILINYNPSMKAFMTKTNKANAENFASLEKKVNMKIAEPVAKAQKIYNTNQNILTLLGIPFMSIVTFLFFREKYNYAENLAINSYTFGSATWVSALLSFITSFFSTSVAFLLIMLTLLTFLIMIYMYKSAYKISLLMSILVSICVFLVTYIYGFIIQLGIIVYLIFT